MRGIGRAGNSIAGAAHDPIPVAGSRLVRPQFRTVACLAARASGAGQVHTGFSGGKGHTTAHQNHFRVHAVGGDAGQHLHGGHRAMVASIAAGGRGGRGHGAHPVVQDERVRGFQIKFYRVAMTRFSRFLVGICI